MMEDVSIRISNVNKSFKLPHERHGSIKNAFVNIFRGKTTYEKQHVLKDISFEIKKGEFFGIVGRNGSGKSTLLKLLAGIYDPNQGEVQVNGKLIPFIELGVGFNPELTGRENVFLNGSLLGFSREEVSKMYKDIVGFAELEKFMDQKLKNYSSGMQVRLAFSIAIRANGDILLLDEVLAVGDAAFQQKCFDYFEKLKDQKKTVVFVSHDMNSVQRFCSKAMLIKNGELKHLGSPMDIANHYLEENIQTSKENQSAVPSDAGSVNKISAKILGKEKKQVSLEISYESSKKDEMYVGISLSIDGISIAEINNKNHKGLINKGKIYYNIDKDLLNGGIYNIGVALFKKKNRELLAIAKDRNQFVVETEDDTRGGAFKLADTWHS